ncbi:MAG: undecaprenyl/decaprenyl-phosphate alpha-N-acetylglucosaminyl 1-phosphate transferase [Chloroflexi bacterium]|nr:undecaprenyl/decaprenyl-phosphate alpha-N-acetylglucosaminyl 1-phosphate transferase [Chloroflexota bacterium]
MGQHGSMLDIYFLTLALSIGIGAVASMLLLALSRTERFIGLFNVRGVGERPRWGGVVFLATFALTPFIASALSSHASEFFSPKSGSFLGLLAATALVFLVGFLDDVRLTSPQVRMVVFITGGVAAYAAGYRMDDIGLPWGQHIHLGWFGFFVTVFWIVAVTNAFNFIDGRDGVALGVAIFACATMAQIGAHAAHPTVALLLVALAGAGLGFLPFNLPPASAYVGDSGAYVLGFVLGTLSVRASTGPTEQIFIAVPIVALGYPIFDLALAAVRRMLQHKHPMIGDQDHMHHRLEVLGAGPRGMLVIIWGLAAIFSTGAILLHYLDNTLLEAATLAAVVATAAAVLLRLGYIVTIWNSHSIVWLRQRLFAPNATQGQPRD